MHIIKNLRQKHSDLDGKARTMKTYTFYWKNVLDTQKLTKY
jgi:hypothetical protein